MDLSIIPGRVAGYGLGWRGKELVLTPAVPSLWKTLTCSGARVAA